MHLALDYSAPPPIEEYMSTMVFQAIADQRNVGSALLCSMAL